MRSRARLLEGVALLRARAAWAAVLTLGAGLYPRTLAPAAAFPEMGVALAGVVLALSLTAGAVGRDLRTGAGLLWIQKPGRAALHYGGRLSVVAALTLGCHLLAGAAFAVVGLGPTSLPAGTLVVLALTDLAVVAVAFLVSATSVPLDAVAAAVLVVLLAGLGADAVVAPELLGAWAPWMAAIRFPVLELRALGLWVDGAGLAPTPGALLRITLYPLATAALGLALVELRTGGLTPGGTG